MSIVKICRIDILNYLKIKFIFYFYFNIKIGHIISSVSNSISKPQTTCSESSHMTAAYYVSLFRELSPMHLR